MYAPDKDNRGNEPEQCNGKRKAMGLPVYSIVGNNMVIQKGCIYTEHQYQNTAADDDPADAAFAKNKLPQKICQHQDSNNEKQHVSKAHGKAAFIKQPHISLPSFAIDMEIIQVSSSFEMLASAGNTAENRSCDETML